MAESMYLRVSPDELVSAAQRLASLQSDIAEANAAAASRITSIAAAAQDEVSVSVASLFSVYGQQTQAAVEQHVMIGTGQFADGIASAASSYSSAEATNNAFLDPFLDFLLYNIRGGLRSFEELYKKDPLEFLAVLAFLPVYVSLLPFVLAGGLIFVIALIIAVALFA